MLQTEEVLRIIAENVNIAWINVPEEIIIEWFNKYAPGLIAFWCKKTLLEIKGTVFVLLFIIYYGDQS